MFLVAEITRLHEIDDAPQIEQPILQRRAGKRHALAGGELLDGLRHLRRRVLNELRFVKNHGAKAKFLQRFPVPAKQRVIGHDQVVLRNLFAEPVPRRAAFQHEHFQMRRELLRFAAPVVEDRCRTDHERGLAMLAIALLHPGKPRQRLHCFAEPHVIRQDTAQLQVGKVTEEIEALLLIGPHIGLDRRWQLDLRNAFERREAIAQRLGFGRIEEALEGLFIETSALFKVDALRVGAE